jgi:hypothetical protein
MLLLQVFRGITQLRPSEEKHSGKLGTRSEGAVSGGCKWQSVEGVEEKGCKLEREGQHKFEDRDAETMEGKTVHEQKCIEKAAKTGHNNVWRQQ